MHLGFYFTNIESPLKYNQGFYITSMLLPGASIPKWKMYPLSVPESDQCPLDQCIEKAFKQGKVWPSTSHDL